MANSADLQKPTDLDLHCLQRQGKSGFSMTRVKGTEYTFGRFSAFFTGECNFCDFLFIFLYRKDSILRAQILLFYSRTIFKREAVAFLTELPALEVYLFPLMLFSGNKNWNSIWFIERPILRSFK